MQNNNNEDSPLRKNNSNGKLVMTMSPLHSSGKPCSKVTHNETVKS